MKQNLMLNNKSPNSKLNFCFDPLPYISLPTHVIYGLWSHYIKYQMDITILTMPTGLMLTCETSKC